jgi:antitoxin (DNA-binding transcriptional repressor) of toxin-antitoxin stability system
MKLNATDVSKSYDALRASLAEDVPTPFVITRKGKAVAALIPMTDEDVESLALSLDPRFLKIIERSRASIAENGGISLEEMEALFADDRTKEDA